MSILTHALAFLAGVIACLVFTWICMGWVLDGVSNFGRGK